METDPDPLARKPLWQPHPSQEKRVCFPRVRQDHENLPKPAKSPPNQSPPRPIPPSPPRKVNRSAKPANSPWRTWQPCGWGFAVLEPGDEDVDTHLRRGVHQCRLLRVRHRPRTVSVAELRDVLHVLADCW
eukprot:gene3919-biopygen3509